MKKYKDARNKLSIFEKNFENIDYFIYLSDGLAILNDMIEQANKEERYVIMNIVNSHKKTIFYLVINTFSAESNSVEYHKVDFLKKIIEEFRINDFIDYQTFEILNNKIDIGFLKNEMKYMNTHDKDKFIQSLIDIK